MTLFHPLQPLSQSIFLYEPPANINTPENKDNPSLIILCTWLGGATPRRINKYLAQYRHQFPQSCILLITTQFLDISVRSFGTIRARLKPARDAIRRILGPDSTALLHIFSHGGCNTAIQLAHSMKEDETDHALTSLPLNGIILDSCPGDDSFQRKYNAAAVSLPSQPLPVQLIGRSLIFSVVGTVAGLQWAGLMSSVERLRSDLNDPAVLGSAPRLYLYSEADEMVHWRDVRAHIEEAGDRGYRVEGVLFSSGAHCALVVEDAERYWRAIGGFWRELGEVGSNCDLAEY